MSRITMPPYEALAQLIAECKQLDASEVGERWNQFNGAIAVAEMVLRDAEPAPEKPNPLAAPLLDCPFCESPARRTGGHLGGITITTAQCSNDNCIAAFKSVDYAAWNHRAPAAAQPAAAPASLQHQESLVDLFAVIARKHNIATISVNDGDDDKFPILLAEFIHAATCAAPLHESGSAAPIAWISPHLLESLASYRENAKIPSNWSVAVQAAQRNSEDIPLYLNPQGEN